MLEAVVPDMLRTKHLQLGLAVDQLVAQQRAKCVERAVPSLQSGGGMAQTEQDGLHG